MALPESLPCVRGGGVQSPLSPRLPCARGGAAQRRWGCKPCLISRYRANPSGLPPLSRPSGRQLPLHRGAFSCCLPSKTNQKAMPYGKVQTFHIFRPSCGKNLPFSISAAACGGTGGMRDGKILSILRRAKNGRRAKKPVVMDFLHKKVLTRRGFILYNQSLQGCPQEPGIAESDFYH